MQLSLFTKETGFKTCTSCHQIKSLEDFSKKGKGDSKRAICKNCDNKRPGKSDPIQLAARLAKRRANQKGQVPRWVDDEEWADIRQLYQMRNALNKQVEERYHGDHIVPLTSPFVNGFHCMANLQLLRAGPNLSKGNYWWPDMWDTKDPELINMVKLYYELK